MTSGEAGLAGASVLVTGASRGIGRAVVRRLAEAGAETHAMARSRAPLRSLATECAGRAWPCDLTDETAVWEVLEELQEVLGGPPDHVVNAAGAFDLAPFVDTSVAMFDRNLAVNLRGPFLILRALVPSMIARGHGRIVNVGSVAGRRALPGNAAYGASKWGLRGLHEILAEELRGTGVEATLVEPAATDTSLWDPLEPDARDDLPDRASMLRPEDVADVVHHVLTRPRGVHLPLVQVERH